MTTLASFASSWIDLASCGVLKYFTFDGGGFSEGAEEGEEEEGEEEEEATLFNPGTSRRRGRDPVAIRRWLNNGRDGRAI